MENQRQKLELSDIFSNCSDDFLQKHSLNPVQAKAFEAIKQCRTSSLGGHVQSCDHCGHIVPSYNSCRNRHCPKCQFIKTEQWVDKLAGKLPQVRQFHVVFTIPHCLNSLFYLNQQKAYNLLFKAAGEALLKVAANRDFLGAQVGAVGILHTWGQSLVYHPHIHMIVPSGGLSDDMCEWIYAGKKFFVPVKVLSKIFRAILCKLLEQAVANKEIDLPDNFEDFSRLKKMCYAKNWVVYCEKPFSNSQRLISYLGNYTHRVAISNHRLKEFSNGKVTFTYKDYKAAGITKTMNIEADEFIRRFMQHVLPKGFYKVRYFGFMANCNSKTKLEACFSLIQEPGYLPVLEGLNAIDVYRIITGKDPLVCSKCKVGKMRQIVRPQLTELAPP